MIVVETADVGETIWSPRSRPVEQTLHATFLVIRKTRRRYDDHRNPVRLSVEEGGRQGDLGLTGPRRKRHHDGGPWLRCQDRPYSLLLAGRSILVIPRAQNP